MDTHWKISTDSDKSSLIIKDSTKTCRGTWWRLWSLYLKPETFSLLYSDNEFNNKTYMFPHTLLRNQGVMAKPTLFLCLSSFYLLNHCAKISCAKTEAPHIKLYSEHRLHLPRVLCKNPIIRLKVRETLHRSNQCHTLYWASVQCKLEPGSSVAIFKRQFNNNYHSRSAVHLL